jgi:hypothetical protein
MTKSIRQLKPGEVILKVPYGGRPEELPLVLESVAHAVRTGCRILVGTNPKGERIQIPVGHWSNQVEVQP